jgi:hypothetical protein
MPSGLALFAQAWLLDPAATPAWSATNALECVIL